MCSDHPKNLRTRNQNNQTRNHEDNQQVRLSSSLSSRGRLKHCSQLNKHHQTSAEAVVQDCLPRAFSYLLLFDVLVQGLVIFLASLSTPIGHVDSVACHNPVESNVCEENHHRYLIQDGSAQGFSLTCHRAISSCLSNRLFHSSLTSRSIDRFASVRSTKTIRTSVMILLSISVVDQLKIMNGCISSAMDDH